MQHSLQQEELLREFIETKASAEWSGNLKGGKESVSSEGGGLTRTTNEKGVTMKGYVQNIEELTVKNEDFRRVL